MKPEISVLIPAWNAESTITAAIWSVLNQSFSRFELLIYIDGATDKTVDMVAPIEDSRIRMIVDGKNRGIVHSRNTLLREAGAPFIAWLDADDIMLPGRLSGQFDFLNANPEIDICGGWAELRNSELRKVRFGSDRDFLQTSMLFRNPFMQSSIMARNFFKEEEIWFNPEFEYTEDYDLYLRCMAKGKQFGMFPGYVVSYRMPGESEWNAKREKYQLDEKLTKLMLTTHAELLNKESARTILNFIRNNQPVIGEAFRQIRSFLVGIKRKFRKSKQYSQGVAAVLLYQRYRLVKLRFGTWRALLLLVSTKPGIVKTMLANRTKWE